MKGSTTSEVFNTKLYYVAEISAKAQGFCIKGIGDFLLLLFSMFWLATDFFRPASPNS